MKLLLQFVTDMVNSILLSRKIVGSFIYVVAILFLLIGRGNTVGSPPIPEKLNEESKAFLRYVYSSGIPPPFTPEARRAGTLKFHHDIGGVFHNYKGNTSEIIVPTSDISNSSDGIPILVYKPFNVSNNPLILVHFHGGGFVTGFKEMDDVACKAISTYTNCIIVSVGYRLAPEKKFPTSHDDGEAALRWIMKNREIIGGADSKIGVMGASAGGNIAASLAHDVPGLHLQILIYPSVDLRLGQKSYQEFANGYFLTLQTMQWFRDNWIDYNVTNITDPRAAPLLRPSFKKLPPAMIIVSECDVLRDEGLEYGQALKDAGVEVDELFLNNTMHMHFHLPGVFNETADYVYREIGSFINTMTSSASRHQFTKSFLLLVSMNAALLYWFTYVA